MLSPMGVAAAEGSEVRLHRRKETIAYPATAVSSVAEEAAPVSSPPPQEANIEAVNARVNRWGSRKGTAPT